MDRHDQQATLAVGHHSHSPAERAKDSHDQQARILARHCSYSLPERAKDRHDQQARIAARHHSYSHPEEPRIGMISRLEFQQSTTVTHKLESQGQA
jgi:hypothetical protein